MKIRKMMMCVCAILFAGCISDGTAKQSIKKAETEKAVADKPNEPVFKNLKLKTLDGKTITSSELDGHVVLIVNVASQCGFTSQYSGLQALFEKYGAHGLKVLGVPCNQFGGQEPGTGQDILDFTRKQFGVTFPLLQKQAVNGSDRSDLMARLIAGAQQGSDVRWNFEKFLVGRTGQVAGRFGSSTGPSSPELTSAIEHALKAK